MENIVPVIIAQEYTFGERSIPDGVIRGDENCLYIPGGAGKDNTRKEMMILLRKI